MGHPHSQQRHITTSLSSLSHAPGCPRTCRGRFRSNGTPGTRPRAPPLLLVLVVGDREKSKRVACRRRPTSGVCVCERGWEGCGHVFRIHPSHPWRAGIPPFMRMVSCNRRTTHVPWYPSRERKPVRYAFCFSGMAAHASSTARRYWSSRWNLQMTKGGRRSRPLPVQARASGMGAESPDPHHNQFATALLFGSLASRAAARAVSSRSRSGGTQSNNNRTPPRRAFGSCPCPRRRPPSPDAGAALIQWPLSCS